MPITNRNGTPFRRTFPQMNVKDPNQEDHDEELKNAAQPGNRAAAVAQQALTLAQQAVLGETNGSTPLTPPVVSGGGGSSTTNVYNVSTTVQDNGTALPAEPAINLIAGTNVALTIADDPANNRTNVTVDAASPALPTFGLPAADTDYNLLTTDGGVWSNPATVATSAFLPKASTCYAGQRMNVRNAAVASLMNATAFCIDPGDTLYNLTVDATISGIAVVPGQSLDFQTDGILTWAIV